MDPNTARRRLALIARSLASQHRSHLDDLQANYRDLQRPDFLWHYLLQSFSTMGKAAGWRGLIANQDNYGKVVYDVLAGLPPADRAAQVSETCQQAKIRMPNKKAGFILGCFDRVRDLGGPEAAKTQLLAQPGREAKIRFLRQFPGIGDKYARNIVMDVHHEDFRDSIAIDARIKGVSLALGLAFASYAEHEAFYLEVAQDAGLSGWELDRLLFWHRNEVLAALGEAGMDDH